MKMKIKRLIIFFLKHTPAALPFPPLIPVSLQFSNAFLVLLTRVETELTKRETISGSHNNNLVSLLVAFLSRDFTRINTKVLF